MITQLNGNEALYKLPLSDETTWGFCATESISPWLEEFVRIMQLEKAEEEEIDRKILFIAFNKNKDKENTPPSETEDWTCYKQGTVYRIWSRHNSSETFVELNRDFVDHPEIKIINMWSTLKAIFRYYVDINCGPMHAAAAEFKGKGVLIAADGGVGKSTCIRRLPDSWTPLCDDNALIIRDKKNGLNIHPMPTWSDHLWSDKFTTFSVSRAVPLNVIVFLKRASIDRVKPLHNTTAIQLINSCFDQVWLSYMSKLSQEDKKEMQHKLFNTACNFAGEVPCYQLEAKLDGKFWEEIERVL